MKRLRTSEISDFASGVTSSFSCSASASSGTAVLVPGGLCLTPLVTDEERKILLGLDDLQRLVLSKMFPLRGPGLNAQAVGYLHGVTKESVLLLRQSSAGLAYAKEVAAFREQLELERYESRTALAEKAKCKLERVLDKSKDAALVVKVSTELLDRIPEAGFAKVQRVQGVVSHEHRVVDPELLRERTARAVSRMRESLDSEPLEIVSRSGGALGVCGADVRGEMDAVLVNSAPIAAPALENRVFRSQKRAAGKGRREREREAARIAEAEAAANWKPVWSGLAVQGSGGGA